LEGSSGVPGRLLNRRLGSLASSPPMPLLGPEGVSHIGEKAPPAGSAFLLFGVSDSPCFAVDGNGANSTSSQRSSCRARGADFFFLGDLDGLPEPLLTESAPLAFSSGGDSGTVRMLKASFSSACRFLYHACLATGDPDGSEAFGVKGTMGLPALGEAPGDAMGVPKLRNCDPAGDCKEGLMEEIEMAEGDAAGLREDLEIADAGDGRGVTRERDVFDAGEAVGDPSTLEATVDSFSASDMQLVCLFVLAPALHTVGAAWAPAFGEPRTAGPSNSLTVASVNGGCLLISISTTSFSSFPKDALGETRFLLFFPSVAHA